MSPRVTACHCESVPCVCVLVGGVDLKSALMSDYGSEKKREIISLFAMFPPLHLNIMRNEAAACHLAAAITQRAAERGSLRSPRFSKCRVFFFFPVPRESFQEVGYGKDVLF